MTDKEFIDHVNKNRNILERVCFTYCANHNRADLIQEILLELYKSLNYFKNNCSFSSWMYRIAKNKCISILRKQKNAIKIVGLEEFHETLEHSENTQELVEQLHEAMRYNSVMDSINEPYRTLFQMYLDGVTYKEISEQTGMDLNLLRQKIDRIKKKLQLRYGNKIIK